MAGDVTEFARDPWRRLEELERFVAQHGTSISTIVENQTGLNRRVEHLEALAQIASASADINTKNKYAGKIIFDSTNIRLMAAAGGAATSTWRVCDNSASVTPS